MNILHVLRSEPDQIIKRFIEKVSQDIEYEEFPLYKDEVDYELLVAKVFASDQVICWW